MPNSVEALGFSRTARFVYVYANVRILIPACHEIEWYVKEDVDLVQQHLNHPATFYPLEKFQRLLGQQVACQTRIICHTLCTCVPHSWTAYEAIINAELMFERPC